MKYLARVARLAADVAGRSGHGRDDTVDRAVARSVDEVTRLVEGARLNVAIARLMELTTALRRGLEAQAGSDSLRDGVHALAVLLSCFAPYTAEEVWSRLGHDVEAGDSVHDAPWPTADPALLVEETVVCVVQVAEKVRDPLDVPPAIDEESLRGQVLASPAVQRALDGRGVRTVIVRAPRLVNVVPA